MYYLELGGLIIQYKFLFLDTVRWFDWHIKTSNRKTETIVSLDPDLLKLRRPSFFPGTADSYMEYRTIVEPTGRVLAEHNRFIFHSVAFKWHDYAWLVSGPSGTGKTTQYRNWKKMWPEEVKILCGDMPVLRFHPDGSAWVYPSPWNGSERWGFENHTAVPLAGIVFLRQGTENIIRKPDLSRKIRGIWHSFIGQADTERQIYARASFIDQLLTKYPSWEMENRGDKNSSMLMRKTFEDYLQGG